MNERTPPTWPAGHRAALVVSIDVDGEYGVIAQHGASDWYWRAQAQYDLDAGLIRLLELLADYDIRATFCWVGRVAEERPDAVRSVSAARHEIATHGWDHQIYTRMTREEQCEDLIRTRDHLATLTGTVPVGHKSPFWHSTPDTVPLLQELGFQWNMDVALGDLPVVQRPDPTREPIIQLPPSRWWDDYTLLHRASLATAPRGRVLGRGLRGGARRGQAHVPHRASVDHWPSGPLAGAGTLPGFRCDTR